jgi:NADPH:quinone reductase-like Zn-dependent oxidoreductase
VHLAFDAVAGSMTSRLLQAMASPAKVIVYGRLADEAAQAHPNQLIFEEKSVEGFWLPAWMAQKHLLQSLLLLRRVQKLMRSDLKSRVRARYPLRQVIQAVKEYQGKMTGGKVLLVPEL